MDNNMDMKIESLKITTDILSPISEIDEFKGAWVPWAK